MTSEHRLAFGDFRFDPATGDLYGPSGLIPLKPKALSVLGYLAARPGRLVSKRELLDALWPDVFVADGVLKAYVRDIRRAIGDHAHAPRFVETAHRRGYRFIAPVRALRVETDVAAADSGLPTISGSRDLGSIRGTVDRGQIQYARSGDVNIACQVLGRGPIDLVFVMGWVSHLEYFWREPSFARFLQQPSTHVQHVVDAT